ncbi:MAG: CRISPR-associated endonuclease Cas2 [Nitrososphaerota archaeon]
MYVIMTYDVNVERVVKVLKIARKYLTWVQNSVLEGEITEANFMILKDELNRIIGESDSITFYILRTTAYMKKETLGTVKGEPVEIL